MKYITARTNNIIIIRLIQTSSVECGTTSQTAYTSAELTRRLIIKIGTIDRYNIVICSTTILCCKAFWPMVLFNELSLSVALSGYENPGSLFNFWSPAILSYVWSYNPVVLFQYRLKSVPNTDLCLVVATIYNFILAILAILTRFDVMARFSWKL